MWSQYLSFNELIDLCKVHDIIIHIKRCPVEQLMQWKSIQHYILMHVEVWFRVDSEAGILWCISSHWTTILPGRPGNSQILHAASWQHCVFRWPIGDGRICIQRVYVAGRHATCQTLHGSHNDHVSLYSMVTHRSRGVAARCGAQYWQLQRMSYLSPRRGATVVYN